MSAPLKLHPLAQLVGELVVLLLCISILLPLLVMVGTAFKPGTDDVRESVSIKIIISI